MRVFNRKSRLQRLLETFNDSLESLNDSLEVPSGIKSGLRDVDPGKALKAGLIAAGSLAGLTAGSAGISSLRRREGEVEDDS